MALSGLIFFFFFKFYFIFLAVLHGMWDLSSHTRGGTCTPFIGSTEPKLLDCQGSPSPLTALLFKGKLWVPWFPG